MEIIRVGIYKNLKKEERKKMNYILEKNKENIIYKEKTNKN